MTIFSSSSFTLSFFSLFFFFSSLILSIAKASVPRSATFKYVNGGELGPYTVEYDGNYRMIWQIFNSPFQLGFYNTTPNAFTLAHRMGLTRSDSQMRWVWEANRSKPVRENATFTFRTDGNLVLADADGTIAWQTSTAKKGVVGFDLLPNGNMVLYDSKGSFVWQSFDYPTDTLLVGQALRVGGVTKLVSRKSQNKNADGPYSLVMEPKGLVMYYKSNNSPRPVVYFTSSQWGIQGGGSLEHVMLNSDLETWEITLAFHEAAEANSSAAAAGSVILGRPNYNSTSSMLRLEIDGNLKVYTYSDKVDWHAWDVSFTLFSRDSKWEKCHLPERCGEFGVCDDNQCVACPSAAGLLGWSKNCEATKVITSCGDVEKVDSQYYKVEGVDHFTSKYNNGSGGMKVDGCRKKCTLDCKCLGYFYHSEASECWIAYDLLTPSKFPNSTHLGYIKLPNK